MWPEHDHHIHHHAEDHNIPCPEQLTLLQEGSLNHAETQLLGAGSCTHDLEGGKQNGLILGFSKAFDKVSNSLL